jgi:hypothetical protein
MSLISLYLIINYVYSVKCLQIIRSRVIQFTPILHNYGYCIRYDKYKQIYLQLF